MWTAVLDNYCTKCKFFLIINIFNLVERNIYHTIIKSRLHNHKISFACQVIIFYATQNLTSEPKKTLLYQMGFDRSVSMGVPTP